MAYDRIIYYPASADIYAHFRERATGKVYDGTTTLATWSDADIASYDVALTSLGGDAYGLTVPTNLPNGRVYVVAFYLRAAASPSIGDIKLPDEWEFRWGGSADSAPGPGEASWYYADQQAVQDVIGERALIDISNEPNATAASVNTARLQRVGEEVDAMIDAKLANLGYVTPMEVGEVEVPDLDDTHATKLIMRGISARMVAWKLNEPRMLLSLSGAPRLVAAIDKVMEAHRESADATLRRIGMRSIYIAADKRYTITAPAEVYIPDSATTYPLLP
jgi:hypothetical protein